MTIALATDHAGLEQLSALQDFLEGEGYSCINFGPKNLNPDDDYPDFVAPAAQAVASGQCEAGIIMGGSGQGEAMAANRFRGVRCGVFYGGSVPKKVVDVSGRISHNPYEIVKLTRLHNNANMLSLAARFLTLEEIKTVVKLWLDTDFENETRHLRRIEKLDKEV